MACMKWVPGGLIFFLTGLAVLGGHLRAYELGAHPRCNYVLAEQALPATDVILVGASRVLRGLDPDYVQALLAEVGTEASVDRLSLNLPNIPQYYPLLSRYLENRGAPKIAYLQLLYNFKSGRQHTWDLPLNPPRNLAFGRLSELAEVQIGAPLNDTGTTLPRQLHASWQNLPAALLTKVEISIFSALRYVPKRLSGRIPNCTGEFLRANGNSAAVNGLTIETAENIEFVQPDPADLIAWRSAAAKFLPLAPDADWRQGETAQLTKLVELLQGAGTEVVFLIMPTIGQHTIDPDTLAEINTVFPGIDIHFPMDAYDGELAEQVAVSFVDTHHANHFGAVYLSRALAADLVQRLAAR
jgi:hypothetical protein